MLDFTHISWPPNQPPDTVHTGYLVCHHCGARVEKGIVNLSEHWFNCQHRIRKQGRGFWENFALEVMTKKLNP